MNGMGNLGGSVGWWPTLGFSSGHYLGFVGLSSALGSVLSAESAEDSLSLPPAPPTTCVRAHSLSLKEIKILKKKKKSGIRL